MATTDTTPTTELELDDPIDGSSPEAFKARAEAFRRKRKDELIPGWSQNADYRRGKYEGDTDDARYPVAPDWWITRAKTTQLFSQLPRVIVKGQGPYKPAGPAVQERLNYRLKKANAAAAINECAVDVVSTAGIGCVHIYYSALTTMKLIPKTGVMQSVAQRMLQAAGLAQPEMIQQPFVSDMKFCIDRFSPADLLRPLEFVGSDFDQASWIGRDARCTYAESLQMFPMLKDVEKSKIVGDNRTSTEKIVDNEIDKADVDEDVVAYTEIYYWRYRYHVGEKSFSAIQRLVFVDGVDEPIINEPWKGQQYDPQIGKFVGATRFPIQVVTIDYTSDEANPPSTSAMIRPAVRGLIRYRQQQDEQREHSLPIRWYDVNRVDSDIQTALMNGEFQGFIPTEGSGDKAIGEIARSNYSREDMEFERKLEQDMSSQAGVGVNQALNMAPGERSATEAKVVQGNYQSQTAKERAQFTAFLLRISDVMLGLMCLYDDFALPQAPEGDQRLQMWDRKRISHEMAFNVLGDSSVINSAEYEFDRAARMFNMWGKTGFVNNKLMAEKMAEASGYDPDELVTEPPAKGPDAPQISLRFTGVEDVMHPIVAGLLYKNGQLPNVEDLKAINAFLESVGAVVKLKMGSKEDSAEMVTHQQGTPPMVTGGAPTAAPPKPGAVEDHHPEMNTPPRINTRRDSDHNTEV